MFNNKIVKCDICKKNYNEDDIFFEGPILSVAMCTNCHREKSNRISLPIPTKPRKWYQFWIFMLLFCFAATQINALDFNETISLISPESYLFSFSNETNITYNYNISCGMNYALCNSSNITIYNNTCSNSTYSKCEVSRSLSYGEQFSVNNDACSLDFRCPSCTRNEIINKTYYFDWQVSGNNNSVTVMNTATNETRTYPKLANFTFIDDFEISCEDLRSNTCEDNAKEVFNGINISQQQWYWLCLEPFGKYGESVNMILNTTSSFQRKIVEDSITLQEANRNLAEQNGKLSEQLTGYDTCKSELGSYKMQVDRSSSDYAELKIKNIELSTKLNGRTNWLIAICVFDGIVLIVGFIIFFTYFMLREN